MFFEQLEELYGKKTCKKVQKTFKKVLTRESGCDIISKLSERGGGEQGSRKNLKKVEKTFRKPLDKAEAMWYNSKAVRKEHSELDH